jgi:hypothetical protein
MSIPVRPHLQYVEDVRRIICRPPFDAPADFLDRWCGDRYQWERCEFHRQIGLTPEQSAEEFKPFIEAALNPRYNDSFRNLMDTCRAKIAEIERSKPWPARRDFMRFETDDDERVDVQTQTMLNVLTDAGTALANMLPAGISAMGLRDGDLIIRWKQPAHPLFKAAIEKAWVGHPCRSGNIIHEESPG